MDLSTTIEPKSDQQNFDDYATGESRTVTVERVRVLGKGADQPVEIHLVEFPGRPYKPSKTMRRVLVIAWGKDGDAYVGRKIRLYGDPDVTFAGQRVGGIKISHLSHIDGPLTLSLTESKGHRAPHSVQPLSDAPAAPKQSPAEALVDLYLAEFKVTKQQLEARVALPFDEWAPETLNMLRALGGEIKNGTKTVEDEFPGGAE